MRVLVVCTGNICRSPMVEHLLRTAVPGLDVSSGGTYALVGQPMQPFALAELAARGIDGSGFRASALTAARVEQADLVITAAREHRAAVVTLHPRAAARTFTLRELDRLLSAAGEGSLVEAAAGQRGRVRADRAEDDDVPDPYRRPAKAYATCAALLEASLVRVVDRLRR